MRRWRFVLCVVCCVLCGREKSVGEIKKEKEREREREREGVGNKTRGVL